MSETLNFKIVTYNIQFSLNQQSISDNILELAQSGVDIFCLQEVARQKNQPFILKQILAKLGGDWKEIHNVGTEVGNPSLGNCIIWNNTKFNLKNQQKFTLRQAKKFALHEWLLAKLIGGSTQPYLRRSIIGNFKFENQEFSITNLHLDHIGGVKHRAKQLKEALINKELFEAAKYVVVCGDFNNFDVLKNGKQNRVMKKIFGPSFEHVTANLKWTADLYHIDMPELSKIYRFVTKKFKIHIRKRLDSIWIKGLRSTSCQKIDLMGSDHFPILAELHFD